jgi:hypothetical protein
VFPDVPPSSSRTTILGSPGWCEVWGFFYMRNPAAGTRPPREDDTWTPRHSSSSLLCCLFLVEVGTGEDVGTNPAYQLRLFFCLNKPATPNGAINLRASPARNSLNKSIIG